MPALPLRRTSQSRFTGRSVPDLFNLPTASGRFDNDSWDLSGHADLAGGSTRRIHFDSAPVWMRDSLKELVVLATRPAAHAPETSLDLLGVASKDLKTVIRWLGHLVIDLEWIASRAGGLVTAGQPDFTAWKNSDLNVDYRRIAGLQAFARYSEAMSQSIERLTVSPWRGKSALAVAGGVKVLNRQMGNSTPVPTMDEMAPWLTTAMFIVEHGTEIVDLACARLNGDRTALENGIAVVNTDGESIRWLDHELEPAACWRLLQLVTSACVFTTATFTGMRASELDAVPRHDPLQAIEVAGVRRWLLRSYLIKGQPVPKPETWLIPPIVADAIRLQNHLLDSRNIPADKEFPPTGKAPLFDRRSLSVQSKDGASTVLRLERAISYLRLASPQLSELGVASPLTGVNLNGRQLRRAFAVIVSRRPHGPQAAMEQFKWQHEETAAGYFRVAPEAVALGQREIYAEVAELHQLLVVDALTDEYSVWARAAAADEDKVMTPAGPDGRRKRDMFAAVQRALTEGPRIEEDDRRLRVLLRAHADSIHLTEFGWCDWDEDLSLCGGIGGPDSAACRPSQCLNHSTPSTNIAAHQVKHDRLLKIVKDKAMPSLARSQAKMNAELIEADLGDLLKDNT